MKIKNVYVEEVLGLELYNKIPKAVFAAIAVSTITMGGDNLEQAKELLLNEWRVLHDNQLVPQKPLKLKEEKP